VGARASLRARFNEKVKNKKISLSPGIEPGSPA
jgi:hypothetical protein